MVRIIACIEEPVVTGKILIHLDKKGAAQETGLLPEAGAVSDAAQTGLFD